MIGRHIDDDNEEVQILVIRAALNTGDELEGNPAALSLLQPPSAQEFAH